MTIKAVLRAVLYIRVSTDEQAKSGYSIPDQLRELTRYAEQQGYEIVDTLIDDGYSGASLDRPGLMRVYELAADGAIDAVIATKRDRLFRNQLYRLQADRDLKEYGVRLVALNDTGNKIGDSVLDSYSEWERDTLMERSHNGKQEKALQGKIIAHHRAPYGFRYSLDRTSYIPDETMPVVRRVFRMVYEGNSIAGVKKTLDNEGVPTPGNSTWWNTITIRRMLLNDLYNPHEVNELEGVVSTDLLTILDTDNRYGIWYRCKGSENEVAVPVPHETSYGDVGIPRDHVDAARKYLETTHRWRGKPGRRFYELRGFMLCGACGGKMTSYHNSGYYYYSCIKRRNHGRKACPDSHNQNADRAEKKIMEDVSLLLQDPERVRANVDAAIAQETSNLRNPDEEAATWLRVIEKCDRDAEKQREMFVNDLLDIDRLRQKLEEIERTKTAAEQHLEEARGGQQRIEDLKATKRTMLEAYASGMLYDGIEWFSPEMRHGIYEALGLRATVFATEDGKGQIGVQYNVDANVVRLTRGVQDYAEEVEQYRDKLRVSNKRHPDKIQRCSPPYWPGIPCWSTTPVSSSPSPPSSASCSLESR